MGSISVGWKPLLAAVVCGPIVLAGCGSSGEEPAAAPTPKPSASADPDGPVASAAAVPIAQAKGLKAGGSLPRTAKGFAHSLTAVADDGALVMYVYPPDKTPISEGVRHAAGRLEVVRPGAKAVRIPGASREVDNVAADRRHVVWAENVPAAGRHAAMNHGGGPFRILTYDRQTKAVRALAYLPASSTGSAPAVSIADGRAFWTVRGIASGVTDVFSRAFSGHGRIVRHLRTPGVVDAGADGVFLGVSGTGTRSREFRILQLDPNTGATHVVHTGRLAKGAKLSGVVAEGGALAWTTATENAKGTVTRVNLREKDGKVIRFAPDLQAGGADLTDRFLSLEGDSEDGKVWLYDRSRAELVALGASPGREAVMGAGGHVAWADGEVWRYAEVAPEPDRDDARAE